MKTQTLLIGLVFMLLIIGTTSCKTETETGTKFVGGTVGLLISFVEGAPPETVHTGGDEPFTVSVKLENKGEYTIEQNDCTVSLKGFDPGDFGTTLADLTKHPTEDLFKTELNPDTGKIIDTSPVFVDFDLNYVADISGASHEFPIIAEVCYKYQTTANAELCIKKDLLDTTDTDICEVIGDKTVYNSGAPIQVTEMEEFTAGKDAIRFIFTIKKMGNGDVYSEGSLCSDERVDEDKVYVKVDSGIDGLKCTTLGTDTTEGVVKLVEGEKQVMCTQPLGSDDKSDKVKFVDITLGYDYKDQASTSISVVSQSE